MKPFIKFIFVLLLCGNSFFSFAQYRVIFQLNSPPAKDSIDNIFLAGSFNNWNPGDSNFIVKNKKLQITLPPGKYEYKFTLGNWGNSETKKNGESINNRTFTLTKDTTILIEIQRWNEEQVSATTKKRSHTSSSNVHIMDTAFFMPQLNRYRRIWIYLPPDYESTKKSYPVLYMQDGQNLFDETTAFAGEWAIDEYLDSISTQGKKESIVIGIDNGLAKRMTEYNPWEFQKFGKGEGDLYVDFLVKTLKPFVDKHYRTYKNKKNTFIAGSSMGGLISLYAVLKYPSIFGGAGIFSPAFWTASGIDKSLKEKQKKVQSKLFFYAGGKEGKTMISDMKRIESEMNKNSKSSFKEIIDKNASHNEAAWRTWFPSFYEWAIIGQ